jgi:DNA-3-methyladenine glycosylase II
LSTPQKLRAAERHLMKVDPRLAEVIRRARRCDLSLRRDFEPFSALTSSICHQQLHGKAAMTILGRLKDKVGKGDWPTPAQVKAARMQTLRGCGLSRAKSLALKDLAAKVLDGTVPAAKVLHTLDEETIITRLTEVRGVGRWTVEMLLMFSLGRLDVLPVGDFGVRKGFSVLHKKKVMVTPKQLLEHGEKWRPYRTVAAWYLWRASEEGK